MFNTNIGSNLIKKNDALELDTSVLKISIISGLGILAAIALSYFTNLSYKEPNPGNLALTAIFILIFIIIFFLQSLFVKSISINMLIASGETLGLASFLIFSNYSFILLVAIALTYLALYASIKKSQHELKNQLVISINKIAKLSVPKIVTAIVILISVIYSQPFFPDKLDISKDVIRNIVAPAEIIIKKSSSYLKSLEVKNFSFDMNLDQIAQTTKLDPKILQESFKSTGIEIGLQETLLDAMHSFVQKKINGLDRSEKWRVFGSIFLLIFLTIRGFFWLFYWLIYLLIYLVYEILVALGFCKLTYEQISKEIIIL